LFYYYSSEVEKPWYNNASQVVILKCYLEILLIFAIFSVPQLKCLCWWFYFWALIFVDFCRMIAFYSIIGVYSKLFHLNLFMDYINAQWKCCNFNINSMKISNHHWLFWSIVERYSSLWTSVYTFCPWK